MKKWLFSLVILILTGCAAERSAPPSATAAADDKTETEQVFPGAAENQDYLIQDTNVHVTKLSVVTESSTSRELYLISTAGDEVAFSVDSGAGTVTENLGPRMLSMVRREVKPGEHRIDLFIGEMISNYAVENVLNLDRCRSLPLHEKIVQVLSARRRFIYFGLRSEKDLASKVALRWNMDTEQFVGFIKTDDVPSAGEIRGNNLLLTPNDNVRDANSELVKDSAFLSAKSFNSFCQDYYPKQKRAGQGTLASVNDDYYPRYDAASDLSYSSQFAANFGTTSGFAIADSIYKKISNRALNDELVTYAQKHSNFKTFIGASK